MPLLQSSMCKKENENVGNRSTSVLNVKNTKYSQAPGRIFRRFSFVWVENPSHRCSLGRLTFTTSRPDGSVL
jgi:hypothetical protein